MNGPKAGPERHRARVPGPRLRRALDIQDKLVTPLAHLVGSASLKAPVPLVRVTVANAATVSATGVTIEADLVGYGTPASQSVDIAAGASATATLAPALDLPKLLALSTEVPAGVVTTARWGGAVSAQQTRPIGVLGRCSFDLKDLMYLPVLATSARS